MSDSRLAQYVPLIQRFAAQVVLFHEAVATRVGLNSTDFKCLRLLGLDGIETASDLAKETGLTPAAISLILGRLERLGFVVRKRSATDRRRVTVVVVPARKKKIDALYRSQAQTISKTLARYGDEQFATLLDFISTVSEDLKEKARKLRE
jgi:DNA-binding MarR family transcriptional regulator